jgi:hypothetical protein
LSNHPDDLGWAGDLVGKMHELRIAMEALTGKLKGRARFDEATFCLVKFSERDFPERLQPVFKRILDSRIRSRRVLAPDYVVFAFEELPRKERNQIVADIRTLHDACLIDIGRVWPKYEFMYPTGELPIPPKRRRHKKPAIEA